MNKTLLLIVFALVNLNLNAQKALDILKQNSSFDFSLPEPDSQYLGAFEDISSDLNGEDLFQYLHKRTEIKNNITYTNSKNLMFSSIDNVDCNGKNGVVAFYSLICVYGNSSNGEDYKENGDQNGDGYVDSKGMNVEHIWPQSFFNQNLPMRADLHHLRPTFMKPNNERATYPFCNVTSPVYKLNSGAKLGNGCFEPPDKVKGDVARALFYFVMRYYDKKIRPSNYDEFFIHNIKTYMYWNKIDPPDEIEKERNERIYLYQGNRNPFVDDYSLVDRVGELVWSSH